MRVCEFFELLAAGPIFLVATFLVATAGSGLKWDSIVIFLPRRDGGNVSVPEPTTLALGSLAVVFGLAVAGLRKRCG